MKKNFIETNVDSGSGDADVVVTASANNSTSTRSESLKVSITGIERTVTINQSAGGTPVTFTSQVIYSGGVHRLIINSSKAVDTNITITADVSNQSTGATASDVQVVINSGASQGVQVFTPSAIIPPTTAVVKIKSVSPAKSSTQIYQY